MLGIKGPRSILSIDGQQHFITLLAELLRERRADCVVIIDNQHTRRHGASATAGSSAAGRSTRATAPPPGRFDSVTCPPFAAAKLRAISSPSPRRAVSLSVARLAIPGCSFDEILSNVRFGRKRDADGSHDSDIASTGRK